MFALDAPRVKIVISVEIACRHGHRLISLELQPSLFLLDALKHKIGKWNTKRTKVRRCPTDHMVVVDLHHPIL